MLGRVVAAGTLVALGAAAAARTADELTPKAADAAARTALMAADSAARIDATAAGDASTADALGRVLAATPNASRSGLRLVDGRLRAEIAGACLELLPGAPSDDTRIVPCSR